MNSPMTKPASGRPTDARPVDAALHFLPVETRVPLKFGGETLTSVTCARARLSVRGRDGREAQGWGETPLSVQWVWPSKLPFAQRHRALQDFCVLLRRAWASFDAWGHALEVGHGFIEEELPILSRRFNESRALEDQTEGREHEPMPHLAALVCASAFDIALHDAYGQLHEVPTYQTYTSKYLSHDLSRFLQPASGSAVKFDGLFPSDFLCSPDHVPRSLRVWHLVGGLDALDDSELRGDEPSDGHPVTLRGWIRRDGLSALKVKLRGDDAAWDYDRLHKVASIAQQEGVDWLSADFNCMVREPEYVNEILDRLRDGRPRAYGSLLYVEQPFPYDLEAHRIDVRSVSSRKPLFLDESAHDWRAVRVGRELGWSGVALKTCKTQTGALLSLCWARSHGLSLMVQDLTNPSLAQIPHVLLAAHARTIAGVESNAMQFYPQASEPEAQVHPGLYQRRHGQLDLSTIQGPGLGYRLGEIYRILPPSIE